MSNWRQKEIAAGDFKARCLQLMDEVNESGVELIITKRGKPIAKLVPVDAPQTSPFGWMANSMQITGDIVTSDPSEWGGDE